MATKVVMEALSPTMEEGRLVEWKKQEGDAVAVGDVLAEVETDKAVMELVARAAGTLLKQRGRRGHDGAGGAGWSASSARPGEDVRAAAGGRGGHGGRRRRSRAAGPSTRPPTAPPPSRRLAAACRRLPAAGSRPRRWPGRSPPTAGSTCSRCRARARKAGSCCATSTARRQPRRVRPRPLAAAAGRRAAGPPSPTCRSPRSGRRSPSGWRSRSARSRPSTSPPKSTWSAPPRRARRSRRAARRRRARSRSTTSHQGRRALALRQHPRLQRLVAGRPHPLLERGPRRHGGGGRGRPDHAGHPPRRPEVAARDRRRGRRTWRGRARERRLKPEEYTGGDLLGLESRHVRHRPVHRDHQPARGGHPGGRPHRAEAGRRRTARWRCGAGCGSPCPAITGSSTAPRARRSCRRSKQMLENPLALVW